jgi:hypothetical protein
MASNVSDWDRKRTLDAMFSSNVPAQFREQFKANVKKEQDKFDKEKEADDRERKAELAGDKQFLVQAPDDPMSTKRKPEVIRDGDQSFLRPATGVAQSADQPHEKDDNADDSGDEAGDSDDEDYDAAREEFGFDVGPGHVKKQYKALGKKIGIGDNTDPDDAEEGVGSLLKKNYGVVKKAGGALTPGYTKKSAKLGAKVGGFLVKRMGDMSTHALGDDTDSDDDVEEFGLGLPRGARLGRSLAKKVVGGVQGALQKKFPDSQALKKKIIPDDTEVKESMTAGIGMVTPKPMLINVVPGVEITNDMPANCSVTSSSTNNGHTHMAYYDSAGNGYTSSDDQHSHVIRSFVVGDTQTADGGAGHSHPGVLPRPEETPGSEYEPYDGVVR